MRTVVQSHFADPLGDVNLADEPLVIHRRRDAASPHLVVFVHGLGGKRYGPNATWGMFPKLLFDEFSNVDVGLYSYSTLFRRLRFWRSITLDREAEVFGDIIRNADEYRSIFLFGHSMGGLLCKGVVVYLLNGEHQEAAERIRALLLMATPQLGSWSIPRCLAWITNDFWVLRKHSDYLTKQNEFFQNRVCCTGNRHDDVYELQCFAVLASKDYFVDTLSAGIGLSARQKCRVRGSHRSIVKPINQKADAYRFVVSKLRLMLSSQRPRIRLDCRPAQFDDLGRINKMAANLFGGGNISDLTRMQDWWNNNNEVFWVVRRTATSFETCNEEITGYFCTLPITPEVAESVRREKMTGAEIPVEGIVSFERPCQFVYVGAVGARDSRARASVVTNLTTHLYTLARTGPLTILARPISADGLRVAEDFEMHPSDRTRWGLGHVYEAMIKL